MNIYETLRMGALGKRPCRISKSGEAERKMCPYLIGKSKDGEVNVLYYQEDGSSANGRCNRISDIASAEIVDEPWHQPIQRPKTRGSCVVSVDAEVEGYY